MILYTWPWFWLFSSAIDVSVSSRRLFLWLEGTLCQFYWRVANQAEITNVLFFEVILSFDQLFQSWFLYLLFFGPLEEIVDVNLWDILRRCKRKWVLKWSLIETWWNYRRIVLNHMWFFLQSFVLKAESVAIAKRNTLRNLRVLTCAESGRSGFL